MTVKVAIVVFNKGRIESDREYCRYPCLLNETHSDAYFQEILDLGEYINTSVLALCKGKFPRKII